MHFWHKSFGRSPYSSVSQGALSGGGSSDCGAPSTEGSLRCCYGPTSQQNASYLGNAQIVGSFIDKLNRADEISNEFHQFEQIVPAVTWRRLPSSRRSSSLIVHKHDRPITGFCSKIGKYCVQAAQEPRSAQNHRTRENLNHVHIVDRVHKLRDCARSSQLSRSPESSTIVSRRQANCRSASCPQVNLRRSALIGDPMSGALLEPPTEPH